MLGASALIWSPWAGRGFAAAADPPLACGSSGSSTQRSPPRRPQHRERPDGVLDRECPTTASLLSSPSSLRHSSPLGSAWWHPRPWLRTIAAAAIAGAAACAFLKSTLEPELSNKWLFYTVRRGAGPSLGGRSPARHPDVGSGPMTPAAAAYQMEVGTRRAGNTWLAYELRPAHNRSSCRNDPDSRAPALARRCPHLGTRRTYVYDQRRGPAVTVRHETVVAGDPIGSPPFASPVGVSTSRRGLAKPRVRTQAARLHQVRG
jgi:hypothetical protein